jgi:hypothetical protein
MCRYPAAANIDDSREYLHLINYPVLPTPFNYDRPAKIAVSSSRPRQIYRSSFLLRTVARIDRQTSTGTNVIARDHDFHRACNACVCLVRHRAGRHLQTRIVARMFIRLIASLVASAVGGISSVSRERASISFGSIIDSLRELHGFLSRHSNRCFCLRSSNGAIGSRQSTGINSCANLFEQIHARSPRCT